jgi:chemotaxis protein methyltransferase CheR
MTTTRTIDSIVADAYFPALSDYVVSATGLVYYASRPEALATHLSDRIAQQTLGGCAEYLELLQDDCVGETELDHLIGQLTIGETHFFRHRELFEALRNIALPEIINRNRETRRLRIWSAGCSIGAEAYTVSILLRRDFHEILHDWNVSIVGTDINRPFLSRATQGRYDEWAFRGTLPDLRQQCFEKRAKAWQIHRRFQDGVTFQYHNLVRHPFPSLVHNLFAFDLILCRNVLIYFDPKIVERIVCQMSECLSPGGWLAVGHAEHGCSLQSTYDVVNCSGATLYQMKQSRNGLNTANHEAPAAWKPIELHTEPEVELVQLPTSASGHNGRVHHRTDASSCSARLEDTPAVSSPGDKLRQIRRLADRGDIEEALQLCNILVAVNSLDPLGHFYQALLLDQMANQEGALAAFTRSVYLDREFTLAHFHLGLVQQKSGDATSSTRSFHNVLTLLEGNDPANTLQHSDGLTVKELFELCRMHIEVLKTR